MNLLKKAFLGFVAFFFIINSSNALVLEGDIILDEATSDSLKISWQAIDGAIGYFTYYDTESHSEDKDYSDTSDDMIEGTGTLIDGLKSDTDYYIALKVADGEGNEGDFSNEFKFRTAKADEDNDSLSNLIITNVDVVDSKTISLSFNVDIDPTNEAEFKIEKKDDNLDEILVESFTINGNIVDIKLDSELEANNIYTITVISLTGVAGETIEAGVDGVIDFNSGDMTELNSAAEDNEETNEETNDENYDIELNSAAPEENTGAVLGGTNLSDSEIKKTAELAANKTEKLPKTGPAEWLLLIFALLLAFGITRFRKQA